MKEFEEWTQITKQHFFNVKLKCFYLFIVRGSQK